MILTFLIELLLLAWTLFRYRHTTVVRLVAAIMVCLAAFQLAEFAVCEGMFGVDKFTWSRLGFVAITALPALGIHALMEIAGQTSRSGLLIVYTLMALFMGYFAFAPGAMTSSVCGGNYVLFQSGREASFFYGLYYYSLEIIAAFVAIDAGRKTRDNDTKKALYGLAIAYGLLLVPTTTVNILYPETVAGIPSIMCGFAVFLALMIALYVLPHAATKQHTPR